MTPFQCLWGGVACCPPAQLLPLMVGSRLVFQSLSTDLQQAARRRICSCVLSGSRHVSPHVSGAVLPCFPPPLMEPSNNGLKVSPCTYTGRTWRPSCFLKGADRRRRRLPSPLVRLCPGPRGTLPWNPFLTSSMCEGSHTRPTRQTTSYPNAAVADAIQQDPTLHNESLFPPSLPFHFPIAAQGSEIKDYSSATNRN